AGRARTHTGNRRGQFRPLPLSHKRQQSRFVQLSRRGERSNKTFGLAIIVLAVAADLLADLCNHALDFLTPLRRDQRQDLLLHSLGGAPQQFLQQIARQIPAQTDQFAETVIAVSSLNQPREPHVGELCSGILGERRHHLLVAANKQRVRKRRFERYALGNGQQMVLALRLHDLDKIGGAQPPRADQNRRRDLDLIVSGEPPDDLDRRHVDRGKPAAKLNQGGFFNLLGEQAQNVVED